MASSGVTHFPQPLCSEPRRRPAVSQRPLTSLDSEKPANLNNGVSGAQSNSAGSPGASGNRVTSDEHESYLLYVGLIFGIALVLRVLVLMMGPMFDIGNAYTADTPNQAALASNLVTDKTFGLDAQPAGSVQAQLDALRAERGELTTVEGTSLYPEFYESPGYPAVLSVLTLTGVPAKWLLLLQCLIGALCVPLVYAIGLGILERKLPSALAAAVVAMHPALLIAPATLAGDAIVVALVLLGVWAVANAERRSLHGIAGGGLAIGVAALFAPMLAWLAPLLGAWMVITERRLRSIGLAAVMVVGTALPVAGWSYRNAQQGLEPWISAAPAVDRLLGTVAAAQDTQAGAYAPQTTARLLKEFKQYAAVPDNAEKTTLALLDTYAREKLNADHVGHLQALQAGAIKLGLDHSLDDAYARLGVAYAPAGYAAAFLGEDVNSATPEEAVTEWVINAWVAMNAALVAAMAVGAALMLWRRRIAGLLLLAGVCGFTVFVSASGASETLRLPIIGLQGLMVMAMFAPAPLRIKKPKKKKIRKFKKLDKSPTSRTYGTPLATEDSLRPDPSVETPTTTEQPALNNAVHPALAQAPATSSANEAAEFAASVQDERLRKLATSGRPI